MTTAAKSWGEALVAVLLLLCVSTQAGAGFSRSQADPSNRAASDVAFDGVWSNPAHVVLIKQFPQHLLLRGQDASSTWSATCVVSNHTAQCTGDGVTSASRHFLYRGTLTWDKGAIIVRWKRTSGGETTAGDVQYVKAQLGPTGDQQRPVSRGIAAHQRGASLDGRNYYLLGEEVTCKANAPGYPRVKSWKNRLEFSQENVLIWQTICNDNPIIQKFDPQQFTVADDLSYVIYKAEKYMYYEKAPKLCPNGQWCPEEEGQ
jgi:hypothetical protein